MAWIESHQELRDHPKVKSAARILSIPRAQLLGHLHCLWWWAMDYAQDGDLSGYGDDDISEASDWLGNASSFVAALVTCGRAGKSGFLDRTPDGRLMLHDWMNYAGRLIERRRDDAARKRSVGRPGTSGEDIQRSSAGSPTDIQRSSAGGEADGGRTVPNSTVPNSTVPKRVLIGGHTDSPSASAHLSPCVFQIFDHYRERIMPSARFLDAAKEKIHTRLKTFQPDDLMQAVDRFAANSWWMERNAKRGAVWFFASDARIEQLMNLEPDEANTQDRSNRVSARLRSIPRRAIPVEELPY